MSKYNDPAYIGKKYNMLTVVGFEHYESPSGSKAWRWRVRCDCGNMRTVAPMKLLTGKTKSCGCMKVERMKSYTEKYRTKHGGRYERLYAIWRGIKNRCCSDRCKDYPHYGGRGINICPEWKEDYASFRSWALANGYSDDLTIERIDCDADYCPENCTWISLTAQTLNKTNTLKVEYGGKTWTLAELCMAKGLRYGTIHKRIFTYGWPVAKAIEKPIQIHSKR